MKHHNKRKKIGKGVELSEGPLDVEPHVGMNDDNFQNHVNQMQSKSERFKNDLDSLNQEIETQNQQLEQKRQQDEAKLAAEEARLQEIRINNDNINKDEHLKASEIFSTALNNFIWSCVLIIKKIIDYISTFIAWLVSLFFVISYAIKEWLDSIFNGTMLNSIVHPLWCYILALIFFILIIIIIILLIVYGISLFTKPKGTDSTSQRSKLLPSVININLQDLSDIFSTDKVAKSFDTTIDKLNQYRPSFDQLKPLSASLLNFLSSPFTTLSNIFEHLWGKVSSSKSAADTKYAFNLVTSTIYGEEPNIYTDPEFLFEGRADNLYNVPANIFSDPNVLASKNINNINLNNTIVNIIKPKDLKWDLMLDSSADINKLPPSLLEKKNGNNISLKDKYKIGVPWIEKDNYYVLSCEGAYFTSDNEETNINLNNQKANILKDNWNTNTCTFNIEDKAKFFNESKKRYINANDLSNFVQ